jgi:ACS family tartrate transporter-like MFS transporter
LLYVVAYLDRVNVGYAALEMKTALGFSDQVLGFGAGIFFLGYFLFEVPGALLVERWSARGWIARIMITWGVVAAAMGFVKTPLQFHLLRFLLGAAEAGFFPGVIVYLTHWFRADDRAKVMALFAAGIPLSNIVGGPLAGALLGVRWAGLPGWRWLFILEALPAIVFGAVTLFALTDWPKDARWLDEDERRWLVETMDDERRRRPAGPKALGPALRALWSPAVLLLLAANVAIVIANYGFSLWMPLFIQRLAGLPNRAVTTVTVLPYLVGLGSLQFFAWSSDRTGERRWHAASPALLLGAGLALAFAAGGSAAGGLVALVLIGAGMNAHLPAFWAIPPRILGGTAAAAAIGWINAVGNLGGFAGPSVVGWINQQHPGKPWALLFLTTSALFGALCLWALRFTSGGAFSSEKK